MSRLNPGSVTQDSIQIPTWTIGTRKVVHFWEPAMDEWLQLRHRIDPPSLIYLLHFTMPVAGRSRHYIGYVRFADRLPRRVRLHQSGQGARLTHAACSIGATLVVARVFAGSYDLERRLKARRHHSRLCPICQAMRSRATGQHDFFDLLASTEPTEF